MPAELDNSVLQQLKTDLDTDTTKEIIASYLQEAPQLLKEAKEAAAAGRLEEFRRAVHTLKSTSANVGAMRLSEASKTLELEAKDGKIAPSARISELDQLFASVRGPLEAWNG